MFMVSADMHQAYVIINDSLARLPFKHSTFKNKNPHSITIMCRFSTWRCRCCWKHRQKLIFIIKHVPYKVAFASTVAITLQALLKLFVLNSWGSQPKTKIREHHQSRGNNNKHHMKLILLHSFADRAAYIFVWLFLAAATSVGKHNGTFS